ncbi:tyrosine-type recombinase/integrase [Frateuria aurantia]|uniref:Integrase n=1 Tax=Frateuria aurantia (strain ATCC 33424 / DSM 6220 / KCTC 2777 / LMG 1558 / NBRC 3245 / NCIMB 13370) TaxID=767434 RepID=H8L2A2_FRAAD|nr:tyrosine-type recombinase/integrase [Frateuria aurantia]AFC84736.1 Integrase [Frateuria aurantia DSM 6220]
MLTDKEIKNIPLPLDGEVKKIRMGNSLYLLLQSSGSGYWSLSYRANGKQKSVTVAPPWPETKAKDAVRKAAVMRETIRNGDDPLVSRRKARVGQLTQPDRHFDVVAMAWYDYRKPAWKPNTASQVKSYLEREIIPAFKGRALDDISTREIATLLQSYSQRGVIDTGIKVRQWITRIYEYARAMGLTQADPCRDVKALHFHHQQGQRKQPHVSQAELPELVKAIRSYAGSPIVRICAELMLWTANRPGVTRSVKWSELDLDAGLWKIAKGRAMHKEGHRHETPLPRQAIAALLELQPFTGHFEHVFPGRNEPSQPISDGAVNAMLKAQGFAGRQTPHGIRHVVSTALNERGYRPDLIERQLTHGDPDKVRGIYNEAMLIPERREMMQAWADELDHIREINVKDQRAP